ncbi:MAG TPA: DUF92 domain-containing protein [Gemmatimonadaceae bacterium]
MPSVSLPMHLLAGVLVATSIAAIAWRAHSLSRSGAFAAIVVGTAAMTSGWRWGTLLVLFFITSSLLSSVRRAQRDEITRGIFAKGGTRDATQVLANGAVYALCAVLSVKLDGLTSQQFALAALGALAAATADTWATELGTVFGGTPRSITTWTALPAGTSGAITFVGTVAMVAGAAFIALSAAALGLAASVPLVLIAGIAGALADSLLGATVQERRWCATCERNTECRIHDCGAATVLVGGSAWMNNDGVNLFATVLGAAIAMLGRT